MGRVYSDERENVLCGIGTHTLSLLKYNPHLLFRSNPPEKKEREPFLIGARFIRVIHRSMCRYESKTRKNDEK